MDAELEDLIKAYDAFIHARGVEAKQLLETYDSKLAETLERRPNLSKLTLDRASRFAHFRWMLAQQNPPTLPPTA